MSLSMNLSFPRENITTISLIGRTGAIFQPCRDLFATLKKNDLDPSVDN